MHCEQAHQATGKGLMARLTEACLEGQLLLRRPVGKTLEALFEIGVVISKPGPSGNRNHHPAQISELKHSCSTAGRQPIEIQQTGSATITQHPPKLPETGCRISQIAQAVGHHGPIGATIRHLKIQSISLAPLHRQPVPFGGALGSDGQRHSGCIDTNHFSAWTQMASQDQGKVTRSTTEIQPLLAGPRRKRQHQLTFPLTMKAEAEPVVQPVVTGCSVIEQLFNSVCITGLQSGRSPSVITMTVAMPTAAEHTMQPASINENSP